MAKVAAAVDRSRVDFVCITEEEIANGEMHRRIGERAQVCACARAHVCVHECGWMCEGVLLLVRGTACRCQFDLVLVEDVFDKLVQPLHLAHALPALVRPPLRA